MKKGLTHIVFIVDRSGSMTSIASDMIGGFNTFIKKQKENPSECFVSFYQFDDIYEKVFERVKLEDVKELDNNTYNPRGSTALYDAMGRTIDEYGVYLSNLKEDDRPERVLVVVITDGLNNASGTFTLSQVRDKIKLQRETYDWDFVFMGSNIDAWEEGASLGVSAASTLQFANVKGSVANAFSSLSSNATMYRSAAVKCSYAFSQQDQDDQNQFLDDNKKSNAKKTTKK